MRRALHVAVLAAFVLGTACDSDMQGVLDEIERETKVGLRDPAQVAVAASGADAMGNKEAEDGLDVVKGFRRAEHESRGGRLRLSHLKTRRRLRPSAAMIDATGSPAIARRTASRRARSSVSTFLRPPCSTISSNGSVREEASARCPVGSGGRAVHDALTAVR
ncbi:MAG: hypothetical protein FJ028_04865 [Chloroflexi bacterium]|nr:hypothetical protein [Chloroflexota bacterium]